MTKFPVQLPLFMSHYPITPSVPLPLFGSIAAIRVTAPVHLAAVDRSPSSISSHRCCHHRSVRLCRHDCLCHCSRSIAVVHVAATTRSIRAAATIRAATDQSPSSVLSHLCCCAIPCPITASYDWRHLITVCAARSNHRHPCHRGCPIAALFDRAIRVAPSDHRNQCRHCHPIAVV